MVIRSKVEWYRIAHLFNQTQRFTQAEFSQCASRFHPDKLFAFRNTKSTNTAVCYGDVPHILAAIKHKHFPTHYIVQEAAPHNKLIIAGEFWADMNYAFVSTACVDMRTALRIEPQHITGFQLREILRRTDEGSLAYERLSSIADAFPAHIIEFSVFSEPAGVFNEPLFVWEVRQY